MVDQLSLNQPYFRFFHKFLLFDFSVNNVIPHTILCYISIMEKSTFPFLIFALTIFRCTIPLSLKSFHLQYATSHFHSLLLCWRFRSLFPLRINRSRFSFFCYCVGTKSTFPLRINHQPFSFFAVLAVKSTFPLRISHQRFVFFATVLLSKSIPVADQPPADFILLLSVLALSLLFRCGSA